MSGSRGDGVRGPADGRGVRRRPGVPAAADVAPRRGRDIYIRIARLALDRTREIIQEEPEPRPQSGEPVTFTRRQPEERELPEGGSQKELFEFIRMLDAEGYPKVFLEHGDFRIEVSRPALRRGEIEADVSITRHDGNAGE